MSKTIVEIGILIAALGIGWLGGFVTKCFGLTRRERMDILRKAVKFGFKIDGKRYECMEE